MGIILSSFAVTKEQIEKRREKKRNKANIQAQQQPGNQQSLHHSSTVERGLQQEELATKPPSTRALQEAGHLQGNTVHELSGARAGGEPEVHRTVGLGGPVPLAVTPADMASDEDYTSFLDKVNQDPNEGQAQTKGGKIELKAVDEGVEVPKVLREATRDAWYTSDADEKFQPVVLKFSGKTLPDESAFAKLTGHPSPEDAGVEIMDIGDWDSQGEYKEVIDAVREAGKGSDVRVYRIGRHGARVEYWVVSVAAGKLVGAKVLAIES